jgi:hypothetical protein
MLMGNLSTVTVIAIVPPDTMLVASVGVKVAVMTEVPAPATVSVVPETVMTDVVPDEYVKVPGTEPVTVGAVTVKAASPKFLATLPKSLKVGTA